MTVYVFPVQGAQSVGMGAELFDCFPGNTGKASDLLGYSIKELYLYDNEGMLNQTQYTLPGLYTVNAQHYLARNAEGFDQPTSMVGHSLGEYNALQAAGTNDFETGSRLVAKRGELIFANVDAKPYSKTVAKIQTQLSKQITSPVQWLACISSLIEQGETEFIEVGPSKILTALINS